MGYKRQNFKKGQVLTAGAMNSIDVWLEYICGREITAAAIVNGELVFTFKNGDTFNAGKVTDAEGTAGNGISEVVMNDDYTLTFEFTDGTSYTTPNLRGKDGKDGKDGAKGDHGSGGKPVNDYGAKGNGTTDDTAAFKSALAENRIVFVPGGTYKLSSGITIGDNSCLELAQDAVLEFTNTTGNCITLGMLSHLKGNHATIKVPYEFEGNVLYAYSCDCSEAEQRLVPPWSAWCPQWKSGRYVTDVNICKANANGNHESVDGKCSGTAVYVSADHTAGLLGYMWGVQYSGLRIAGAFSYGIRCVNFDEGWLHEIRMDAFIDACEIGVSLEDCNNAYISAIVQPRATWHSDVTKRIKYAKHGIQLIRSKNADLSGSRVWDWNADNSLWTDGGEWQSYAMYGDCGSAIISDFAYYSTSFDIRNRIYTDTLENFDRMTILQEPIDKWFKVKRGEPYYSTGEFDRKLVTEEMLANHFTTDVVKKFTDVFPTALDDDGEVCGGVGYKNGYIAGNGNIGDTAFYVVTGFIPIVSGQTLYVQDMSYASYDGYCRVNLYDSSKTLLRSIAISGIVGGNNWHVKYVSLPSGFSLMANGVVDNESVAYVRFSIYKKCLGDYPMASIGEPIEYTVEGFLADGVKVKGENVIGDIGVGQPDWVAKQKLTEGASVWTEREVDFKGTSNVALSDFGGGFKANNGVEYDVYWDGERYECIAKESNEGLYLGNGNLVFGTAEENTGEPFCLYASFLAPDTIFYIRKTGGTPDVLKVKVTHRGYVEYDKMPVEYLPDGVAMKDDIQNGIPYIEGNSTTAGTWTGTCESITEYYDGLTILYKLNVAGTSSTTLNINGLGAVAVNRNASTAISTIYPAGSVVMLTYSGGKWLTADYDANSKNTAGTSAKNDTQLYLVGATSKTSSGTTTYVNDNVYIGADNELYSNGKKVVTEGNIPSGGTSIDVTAQVGQTIIVKEVDASGKPTKWESAEYQPRTHWTENRTFICSNDNNSGRYKLIGGDYYVVVLGGVEYVCECKFKADYEDGVHYLGNPKCVGGVDNGLPFGLIREYNGCIYEHFYGGSGDGSFELYHIDVNKIPTEYLPKSFPQVRYSDTVICENVTVTAMDLLGNGFPVVVIPSITSNPFKEGVVYDVIWNGVKYSCEPFLFDGELAIGNRAMQFSNGMNTGEPFIMSFVQGMFGAFATEFATFTISIIEHTPIVEKLGAEYYDRALFVDIFQDGDNYSTDITPEVLKDAYSRGVPICARVGNKHVCRYAWLLQALPTQTYGLWIFGWSLAGEGLMIILEKDESKEAYAVSVTYTILNDTIDNRLKELGLID